ncbi:MAG: choice-of-anchor D domain-containing protein [Betaproteobacteria bacterium]
MKNLSIWSSMLLGLSLAIPGVAWSADPVAGASKFSQNCTSCHTVASTATVDRGRNSPAKISNAIASIGQMGGLSGLSTSDREDIAAYLGNTPSTLAFAQTTVGQASAGLVVTVKSSSFASISNLSSSVSGDFGLQGGTCGSTLATSSSCTVGVVFNPTAAGSRTGTLSISHSGLTTPVAIALTGTGAAAAQATISLNAASLALGSQVVGVAGTAQTVTVSNTGAAALNFSAITLSGAAAADFATGGTCAVGTAVAASASCTVTVRFTPSATGSRTATLALASNASNGSANIALSGTGVASGAPAVTLGATSLAFGSVAVGTSAAAKTVSLANSGTAALAIQSIQAGGAFTQSSDCGASLAASASCTISVVFTPTAAGAATGSLTITSNAAGSPHAVGLSGTGVLASTGALQWSNAGPIDFGTAVVGTESALQTLTLSNAGTGPADLGTLGVAGTNAADFRVDATSTCTQGLAIAAGGSCQLVLGFVPGAVGARAATLSVASADASVPGVLQLAGTGSAPAAPALTLSATLLSFTAPTGGTAAAQELTLTNSGAASLHVSAVSVASARFTVSASADTPCATAPFALAAGASCKLQVAWLGTGSDASESTQLTVTGDMQPATATVALQGEGTSVTPANDGGGGCTLGANTAAVDPVLAAMALIAAALIWRRRSQAH